MHPLNRLLRGEPFAAQVPVPLAQYEREVAAYKRRRKLPKAPPSPPAPTP